ncbi:MAG: MarR family transcriptional regulator [Dehalococcoidia bacterium]
MQQADETPLAVHAWRQLYLTYSVIFKAIERSIAATDVTLPQALALSTIRNGEPPMTPSRLAHYLMQETQSVTGLIDRMERHGWVRRVRDLRDRRAIRLELTDRGAAKLEETVGPGSETTIKMFDALKPDEVRLLIDLLARVYGGATDHIGPEPDAV